MSVQLSYYVKILNMSDIYDPTLGCVQLKSRNGQWERVDLTGRRSERLFCTVTVRIVTVKTIKTVPRVRRNHVTTWHLPIFFLCLLFCGAKRNANQDRQLITPMVLHICRSCLIVQASVRSHVCAVATVESLLLTLLFGNNHWVCNLGGLYSG